MIDPAISVKSLDQIVDRARQLYSLPAVAMQVIKLTENETVDLRALKQCIENDPALCAKVLRVVNSSLFGLSRQVSDLNQALALLGTKPLKLLVLGFSLPSELFADMARDVFEHYWRGALTKAVAAREFSERVWKRSGDEPFLAGLLQDLGTLVLLRDLGEPYVKFFRSVMTENRDLKSLESATFGFDHTMLSARLLEHWQFPQELVRAVGMPHDVDQINGLPPEERMIPQILHLAELLCELLARGRMEVLPRLLKAAEAYCPLKPPQLESMVGKLHEKVDQLADVLSLELSNGVGYAELLRRSQEQLSCVAESAACDEVLSRETDEALLQATKALATSVQDAVRRGLPPLPVVTTKNAATRAHEHRSKAMACAGPCKSPRETATADVFESMANDVGFEGRVAASVALCRQSRCPLSLLLISLDRFEDLIVTHGVKATQSLVIMLEAAAQTLCQQPDACLLLGEAHLAVILENYDRSQAVEAGRNLVCGMRQWSQTRSDLGGVTVSISAGVAALGLPPKNFPARDLIDAASRCLFASHASGGDVLKSIDIF